MELKNMVFDFGGVLMDWNPVYLYEEIFRDTKKMEYFLTEVCNSEWNEKHDAGQPFEVGIASRIAQFPEYKKEIELYFSHWIKMIGGEMKENTLLLSRLKRHYRLFGLTNWSGETFPLVYDDYQFFKEFEGIVVSGVEKVIKPNRKIYQILLERYDLKPEECLFIDDNLANIEMAKEIGFEVIHYIEGMSLEGEFRSIGIAT